MMQQITLTAEQQTIMDWMLEGQGHGIVEALAGTGKTTLLLELITAYVRKYGFIETAYLQFNKKIKEESAEKIRGRRLDKNVKVLTLNGLGHKVLMQHSKMPIQLDKGKLWRVITEVLDEENTASVEEKEMRNANDLSFELAEEKFYRFARKHLKAFVSKFKTTDVSCANITLLVKLAEHYEIPSQWQMNQTGLNLEIFRLWMAGMMPRIDRKLVEDYQKAGSIDFDDQLWLPIRLKIDDFFFPSYSIILVDEAQDLNQIQQLLVLKCTKPGSRLVIVGDHHQAIYRFRGALDSSIDRFEEKLTGQITKFPLTKCWRCPEVILDTVRYHVPQIWSGIEGGEVLFREWEDIVPAAKDNGMVLCRLNLPLFVCFYEFIKQERKAYMLGRDLIKTLVGITKIIVKPKGFQWDTFDETAERFQAAEVQKIINKNGGDHQDPRIQLIEDQVGILVHIWEFIDFTSIQQLENHLNTIFAEKKDAVVLSTVHKAKGLEADQIIFIETFRDRVISPMMSSFADENEENNLIYIARTRAKKQLILINKPFAAAGFGITGEPLHVHLEPTLEEIMIDEDKAGLEKWF